LVVKILGFRRIESKPSPDEEVLVGVVVMVVVSFRLCPEKSCASTVVDDDVNAGNTRK
jgi:hypothetical protein